MGAVLCTIGTNASGSVQQQIQRMARDIDKLTRDINALPLGQYRTQLKDERLSLKKKVLRLKTAKLAGDKGTLQEPSAFSPRGQRQAGTQPQRGYAGPTQYSSNYNGGDFTRRIYAPNGQGY